MVVIPKRSRACLLATVVTVSHLRGCLCVTAAFQSSGLAHQIARRERASKTPNIPSADHSRGGPGTQAADADSAIRSAFLMSPRYALHTKSDDSKAKKEPIQGGSDHMKATSFVSRIRSYNLGGAVGKAQSDSRKFFSVDLDDRDGEAVVGGSNLIAITGETGSGKSILVSRTIDLITGGKAPISMLKTDANSESSATAEVDICLHEPHSSFVRNTLSNLELDAKSILGAPSGDGSSNCTSPIKLVLKRTISARMTPSKTKPRVKSTCYINGEIVTLKALKAISSPLLAIVDAPAAAAALARPKSRMAMIDTAVPSVVLSWVRKLQRHYAHRKHELVTLEKELASRTLPSSVRNDERDVKLLQHWVDELDGFEARMSEFVNSASDASIYEVAVDDADDSSMSGMARTLLAMSSMSWMDSDDDSSTFSSRMYQSLQDLLDFTKALDDQIAAAMSARESLASRSASHSAAMALERTRDLLLDAASSQDSAFDGEELEISGSRVVEAAEQLHHLLNKVEEALEDCTQLLDDDNKGLIAALQAERSACSLSFDQINDRISEWHVMSRKHGVAPQLLPSCHAALRQELDGNVHARTLLPGAIKAETKALEDLRDACQTLTTARTAVANRLSAAVTRRLPPLGMDSSFEVKVLTDQKLLSASTMDVPGIDTVDFSIRHNDRQGSGKSSPGRGGKMDSVASSGEKARILLAIACELPGSIGALCNNGSNNVANSDPFGKLKQTEQQLKKAASKATSALNGDASDAAVDVDESSTSSIPPIAVVYDEIDAHVGGRAAVAVSEILAEQSRSYQVLSITHSPSVAANADVHIVIQKIKSLQELGENEGFVVSAQAADGPGRRSELARMASGDLATKEAEAFADALIRHGQLTREKRQQQSE